MRIPKPLVFALVGLLVSPDFTLAADLRQEDKQKHVVATSGISSMTYGLARKYEVSKWNSFFLAIGMSLSIGTVKELSDSRFDNEDMEANLVGATAGTLFFWSTEI